MFVQCCICRGHIVLFKHLQILRSSLSRQTQWLVSVYMEELTRQTFIFFIKNKWMSMFIQAIRVIQDSHSFFFFFSFYSQRKWNTDWSICKCGVCWDCWTAWLWIFLHGVLQVFVLGTNLFILVRWSLLKWAVLNQNKLLWAPVSFREEENKSSMSKLMLTAKLPKSALVQESIP